MCELFVMCYYSTGDFLSPTVRIPYFDCDQYGGSATQSLSPTFVGDFRSSGLKTAHSCWAKGALERQLIPQGF